MGQNEIYCWLKEKRENKDNRYFSTKEIHLALNEKGKKINRESVYQSLNKLYLYGFLETIITKRKLNATHQIRLVRLKKQFCNDEKK